MQSRSSYSLVASLFLTAVACAHQLPDDITQADDDDSGDEGGSSSGGTSATAGKSSLPLSGTSSISGSSNPSRGGTSSLPPAGSSGKSSTGGSGGKGAGGKGGTGGTADTGGTDGGPINMPIVGLSVTFAADSKGDNVDFLGGELDVINDTAQPLTLATMKVRYYFGNEITTVAPTVMMNWAQFGTKNNLGGATCTGAIAKATTPKAGADSYVELTCSASGGSDLKAGTLLKISWKAGAQGQGKFIQSDDWSLADPTKIVVMNGNTIVWGVEPS